MTIAQPLENSPDHDRRRFLIGSLLLISAIFLAYLPVIHGGPVWDDDYMLTANPVMVQPHGLRRIFFDLSAVQVYYPLTLATLWAECQVFGLHDLTGYHVINTLLHAANAIVLWRLLRRLELRGAFAVAAIWGLHPVGVESVGWITEHKNTLSGLFYLASMWALLRYYGVMNPAPVHRSRWYAQALALFVLALAAKTTAVTLPAAALLLVWWKRGRISLADLRAIIPFILLAAGAGMLTQYVEVHTTGTWMPEWSLSLPQKVLVSGRALCFYATKLMWPAGLSFAYPRWQADPTDPAQWIYPIIVMLVVICLWIVRGRIGRGPLVGVLFFCGTLFPALGFFHVLYQRYSFVADHFQYLAGIGFIAVVVGAGARLSLPATVKIAAFTVIAIALAITTAQSSLRFKDDEAVWAAALPIDPGSPIANLNYASDLVARNQFDQAMPYLGRASVSRMMRGRVWINLGKIAEFNGDYRRALACYGKSVELESNDAGARFQYGNMLLLAGRFTEAAEQLRTATQFKPDFAEAHDNLGVCLLHLGRRADAAAEFHIAQQLNPDLPLIHRHLSEAAKFE